MGTKEHKGSEEHANTLRQLSNENASEKKEIADLARAVLVLSKEIRELKIAQGGSLATDDTKENEDPSLPPKKKKTRTTYIWRTGLKCDKEWPQGKKRAGTSGSSARRTKKGGRSGA